MKPANINMNLSFTSNAISRLKNSAYSLVAPNIPIIPIAGDIVSFPGLESFSFVVLERRWKYIDENNIDISLLLDLACEEGRQTLLSVVGLDQAPGKSPIG